MRRRIALMLPFMIMFLWGVVLVSWPHQEVAVTKVIETFTKKERSGGRHSTHKKTVAYAVVEVDYNGETVTVTVHDNYWTPMQPGHLVQVKKGITGKAVEYRESVAYELMGCGACCGLLVFAMDWIIIRLRAKAAKEQL